MLRAYSTVGYAIHDLAHLQSLSPEPGHILVVSERTLYVLQNLAASDAAFKGRYAKELLRDHYDQLTEDQGTEYELYADVVNNLQLETLPVSEIIDLLEEIRDRLNTGVDAHQHVWNGNLWSKQAHLYDEQASKVVDDKTMVAVAGVNTLYSDVVPAGFVMRLEVAQAWNATSGCTAIQMGHILDANNFTGAYVSPIGVFQRVDLGGGYVLFPGDSVYSSYAGCTAGDVLHLQTSFRLYAIAY